MAYIKITPEGPELRLFQPCPKCGADGPHPEIVDFIVTLRKCAKCGHIFISE